MTTETAPAHVEQQLDVGERERFTHIVLEAVKTDDGAMHSLNNSVVAATVYGTPVTVLCGKVWVPGRDPKKYPICPTCKEIATSMGWSFPAR